MATKIAHVSDIHIERWDANVSDRLIAALRRERPAILVASGDFADQPWHVRRGQEWLETVREACGVEKSKLMVVPGNHDYGIFGIVGIKPITGYQFRKQFPDWNKPRVVLVERGKTSIAFFKFDSNPWILNFARGRIWSGQLKKIRRELDAKTSDERSAIDKSTKIVVVHHHPFPVPYEGKDTFLMLKNAQSFIQFLAERKIDIVLHGHKHRAPHSLLELGTCVSRTRVIEVVGAGTAVAENDQDSRGNNFNIIVVEDNGLHYVRQYFAQPGEDFREVPGENFATNAFDLCYRKAMVTNGEPSQPKALEKNYQYRRVHLDMQIDQEGDATMVTSYVGVSPVGGQRLTVINLPEIEVEKGHLGVSLQHGFGKTSEGVKLEQQEETRKVKLKITFENSPTEALPANFALLSYAYNAFALDLSEYKKKYPNDSGDVEWAKKEVGEPMEQLSFALQLPSSPHLEQPPWFDVVPIAGGDSGPEGKAVVQKRDEWLTRELQYCFYYSDVLNTAFLSIRKPPMGYMYRISWHVPEGAPMPKKPDLDGQRRLATFAANLLEMRNYMVSPPETGSAEFRRLTELQPVQEAVNKALAIFVESVVSKIKEAENLQVPIKLDQTKLDITLMVYDDTGGDDAQKKESPVLRIVAGNFGTNLDPLNFTLEVGDGNAGRAYKKGIVRSYDKDKAAKDPKHQTFVTRPNSRPHQILYSIPMLDSRSPTLIFGILNFGTFSKVDADFLRTLDNQESLQWMSNQAQSYVLTKLLEALRIN